MPGIFRVKDTELFLILITHSCVHFYFFLSHAFSLKKWKYVQYIGKFLSLCSVGAHLDIANLSTKPLKMKCTGI